MTEGYRGTAVRLETTMLLVDFEGNPAVEVAADGDVTDRLELQGSVISKDASAPITGTAQFVFRDTTGFDPGRHLLKPTVRYVDLLTSHSISTQMGLWVMKPFTVSLDRTERVTIQCSDMTDVLSTFLRAGLQRQQGGGGGSCSRPAHRQSRGGGADLGAASDTGSVQHITLVAGHRRPHLPGTRQPDFGSVRVRQSVYDPREGHLTAQAFSPVAVGQTTCTFDTTEGTLLRVPADRAGTLRPACP